MKIAVNARFLIPDQLEGIGIFTHEVLKRWISNHPEHHFVIFYDRHTGSWFGDYPNVTEDVAFPPARHPLLWLFWFEISLPAKLKKHQPDLFVSMDGFLPLNTDIPSLSVIHDLAFEHYPEDVPLSASLYYRHFFPRFAQKADRIATVSEFSKNDIARQYNVDKNNIDVVYNGVNENFSPLDENQKQECRDRISLGQPYFIYVGALHKRKNIARLLKAFDHFRKKTGLPHKLVLIGRKAWKRTEMEQAYNEIDHANDVIFTGRISNDDLRKYLASATALTYVSYFEGFGIPLLEAMYCETAVITSSASCLPEVAGDAALFVDPGNVEDIADKMQEVALNETLREELILKGRQQRQKFNWNKTADRMWQSVLGLGIGDGRRKD